tara:strand:+ start:687 stop:1013 length:327 start_codon:yes stop_codon:yes gene_type:complete
MGKWITMSSGKKVFLATNNPHTESERYIIKQENDAKREFAEHNNNHKNKIKKLAIHQFQSRGSTPYSDPLNNNTHNSVTGAIAYDKAVAKAKMDRNKAVAKAKNRNKA